MQTGRIDAWVSVFGFSKWMKTCAGCFTASHGAWITTQDRD